MAKIEYVERRLELWALWVARGRSLQGGMLAMFDGEPGDGAPHANIPLDEEECWLTDSAIKLLPDPLAETVAVNYLSGGEAAKRRMGIRASALSQRLERAHKLLYAQWAPKTLSANSLPRGF
jgi:DNA-directed RNA polymerase specialized sigma24 family protein